MKIGGETMSCKHAGGTEPCERNGSGDCPVQKKSYERTVRSGVGGVRDNIRVGYIAELLVAADLNSRCGRAYPNPEPQTKDDVYSKTSRGWRSVQVKVGRVNRNTGSVHVAKRDGITSDILAVVDLHNRRVRYESNTAAMLPPELPSTLTDICSTLVVFATPQEAARMPIYSYYCAACRREEDRIASFAERDKQTCGTCGLQLENLIARPASFTVGKYGKGGGLKRAPTK